MLWCGMRFPLQIQYAICGVFDLAYNGQGAPVQIRVISQRQGIPARYLEQIFQRLRRASLVVSKRGPGGGYSLAREPAAITLCDIVQAMSGPLSGSLAMPPAEEPASQDFRPDFLWGDLADGFAQVLEATTLEILCRRAGEVEVARAGPDAPMWFI